MQANAGRALTLFLREKPYDELTSVVAAVDDLTLRHALSAPPARRPGNALKRAVLDTYGLIRMTSRAVTTSSRSGASATTSPTACAALTRRPSCTKSNSAPDDGRSRTPLRAIR